jgi:hypothetical protein
VRAVFCFHSACLCILSMEYTTYLHWAAWADAWAAFCRWELFWSGKLEATVGRLTAPGTVLPIPLPLPLPEPVTSMGWRLGGL